MKLFWERMRRTGTWFDEKMFPVLRLKTMFQLFSIFSFIAVMVVLFFSIYGAMEWKNAITSLLILIASIAGFICGILLLLLILMSMETLAKGAVKYVKTMPRNRIIVVILLLCIVGFLFYRYDYRPSKIRKECVKIAKTRALNMMKSRAELTPSLYKEEAEKGWYLKEDYEDSYKQCLREHGIEK